MKHGSSVRIQPLPLSQTKARAVRLGVGRVASEDLIGCYQGTGPAATNAVVRERMKQRTAHAL